MAKNPKYRWADPHEWLFEKAATWERERLLSELRNLAVKLDADEIQDEFQSEMDEDGYFRKLKS